MKIFLSGPMTGIEDYNRPEFARVTEILRGMGHTVYNPGERRQSMVTRPNYRLLLCYGLEWLCNNAEGMVLLSGHEDSLGCAAEVSTARAIKIPIWTSI